MREKGKPASVHPCSSAFAGRCKKCLRGAPSAWPLTHHLQALQTQCVVELTREGGYDAPQTGDLVDMVLKLFPAQVLSLKQSLEA